MDIKKTQKKVHKIAREKGWWDEERNDGELIALMHSELSEALEALREGRMAGKDGVGEELADTVIRIMDYCEARDIDLQKEIELKMRYNKFRVRKHGKNF